MSKPDLSDNSGRLFVASFLAMIAIGMGFSARGAILGTWGADFGFTKSELGIITGFGLTGFGMTVMLFSVLVERWGYKVMLFATFAFHLLSGVITGPICTPSSRPLPTFSDAAAAAIESRNVFCASPMATATETARQRWPAQPNALSPMI